MQFISKSFIYIVFSVIKDIDKIWLLGLNYFLQKRDKTFTNVGINEPLAADGVPINMIIEGMKKIIEINTIIDKKRIAAEKDN